MKNNVSVTCYFHQILTIYFVCRFVAPKSLHNLIEGIQPIGNSAVIRPALQWMWESALVKYLPHSQMAHSQMVITASPSCNLQSQKNFTKICEELSDLSCSQTGCNNIAELLILLTGQQGHQACIINTASEIPKVLLREAWPNLEVNWKLKTTVQNRPMTVLSSLWAWKSTSCCLSDVSSLSRESCCVCIACTWDVAISDTCCNTTASLQ